MCRIRYTDVQTGNLHGGLHFPSLGGQRRKTCYDGSDCLDLLFYNVLLSLLGLPGDDDRRLLDHRDDLVGGGGSWLTALDLSDPDGGAHSGHFDQTGGELRDWTRHPDIKLGTEGGRM